MTDLYNVETADGIIYIAEAISEEHAARRVAQQYGKEVTAVTLYEGDDPEAQCCLCGDELHDHWPRAWDHLFLSC